MTTRTSACQATTKAGGACQAQASPSGFCTFHDPALAEVRARARRQGGRVHRMAHSDAARPAAQLNTLADARAILAYALAEALVGDNSIARGRLLVAIAQAGIEAWKIGELEQRLAAIEQALKARP